MSDVTHILNVINRKQIVSVLYSFLVLSVSGYALPLGSSDFEKACLEQYIKLNTPGKKDGIARHWINSVLISEKTDFLWRNTDKLKIYTYWMDYYRGGKETANHYHHVYLDNLVIAIGRRVGLYTSPSSSEQNISAVIYDLSAITNKDTLSSDSKGRPYIATYQRPEGKEFPQYHLIYHDDNQWRIQQISRCSIISTVSNKILDNIY